MRFILSTLALCAGLARAADPAPAPSTADSSGTAPAAPVAGNAPALQPDTTTAAAAPSSAPAAVASSAPAADSSPAAPSAGVLELRNPILQRLALSGTVQLKGFYHDFASDRDSDKRLSLQLRRFKLGLEGAVTEHVGFRGEFQMDGANQAFGTDDAYLWWRANDIVGVKGGKLKRPFSQEALQSSSSLYTVERGELYHNFLANTTGYAYYDLGLLA